MVNTQELETMQNEALQIGQSQGYEVEPLNNKELERVGLTFERSLTLQFPQREIRDAYRRHKSAVLLGAAIAKDQIRNQIQGQQAGPGTVAGPIPIRAAYLGIGDDWEDAGSSAVDGPITTGSSQNWIHSGTTLLGGSNGNAIRIGGNAVHVVIGIRSKHPSPKLESIKFTEDGNESAVLNTGWATDITQDRLAFSEFDNPRIWDEDKTVLGEIFASAAHGSTATDYPQLIGASFINESQQRTQDPANLTGTTPDIVLTT